MFDAHHDVLDSEQRRYVRVSAGLGDNAAARVDQHQRDVRGRRAGEHVAGVALVARGIREDERSPRRREEPVSDVDRDALLALGTQTVGDRGKIQRSPSRDIVEVIGEQRPGVQKQAPDQSALAVVDRPRGRQPQQFTPAGQLDGRHQKYPSRFSVLHRRLRGPVVGPGLAAFGYGRGLGLGDHRRYVRCLRPHRPGDRQVADRAIADHGLLDVFGRSRPDPCRFGEQDPVALQHPPAMGEVDRGQLELLGLDVAPHVELGPVTQRKHADVLTTPDARVVERPRLGALRPRLPLSELVAEGEHPLLGARSLLVAPGASERGIEPVLLERVQQCHGLQPVARASGRVLLDAAGVDRGLNRGHDQSMPRLA